MGARARKADAAKARPVRPPRAAVRLIPLDEFANGSLRDVHLKLGSTIELRQARRQLDEVSEVLLTSKVSLQEARARASSTDDATERARVAYEEARAAYRQADLDLRRRQRAVGRARTAVRLAHEWVARLEGIEESRTDDEPTTRPA